jgi:hypothetical protein
MSYERNLLISLLKLTKDDPVNIEIIKKDSRLPSTVITELLSTLQNAGLLNIKGQLIEADTVNRLNLAIKAFELGSDIEQISDYLRWQEFEEIAAVALKINGHVTKKNLRFKHINKRWEIDVVGFRKPLVVCIDCKHWHHGMKQSNLRKMVELQVKRVEAFAESLPNLSIDAQCVKWSKAKFVPIILSLIPGSFKFVNDVPVVPVLQFQDFLNQLPLQVDSLKHFNRAFSQL